MPRTGQKFPNVYHAAKCMSFVQPDDESQAWPVWATIVESVCENLEAEWPDEKYFKPEEFRRVAYSRTVQQFTLGWIALAKEALGDIAHLPI